MRRNLTKQMVHKIKHEIIEGLSQNAIAKKHGISRSIVSDISTGRVHKDVEWPGGQQPPKRPSGGQYKHCPKYDPNNDRIQELEGEVAHLIEERNHARKSAKASQKQQGLFRAVVNEMQQFVQPFKPLPVARVLNPKAAIEEHLVMHLSDGHHDQIVTREECGGLEEYNFPISCRRAENYVDTVIDWTQSTLAPKFHFKVLHVLAYGDHTSGEIHNNVTRSEFRNQFKNCFVIGQLHALMYRDLAPYFDQINVIYLPGNHGRRTPKKDFHGAHDNWDYLIAECAKLHCGDLENVSFLVPNAFSVNLDINGIGFNLSHGDDVRGNLGIPFYGMARRQKGLIALNSAQGGLRIRYFCMGHHHVSASLADIDGELIVNGAWVGTDSYAYNSFSGYREPAQWLHGVHPKHGVTWRLNVRLKSADEAAGPQRYQIAA